MSLLAMAGHWVPFRRRSLRPHRNSGLEIVCVVHGRPVWQTEGRVEAVPGGSVYFTLPWQTHGGVNETEPGCELFFVIIRLGRPCHKSASAIDFLAEMGLGKRDTATISRLLVGAPYHAYKSSPALVHIVRRIVAEASTPGIAAPAAIAALARLAVIELARCVAGGKRAADTDSDAASRVKAFSLMLDRRYGEPWTLNSMATACRMGRTRFAQLYKHHTGDPPIMALNRVRVRHACAALRRGGRSITQIAIACGFSDSQYFARVFKGYMGKTAREYRSRFR